MLRKRASELAGAQLRARAPSRDVSLRVVADHARACAFLVGDGVLPSNEGRGYVLRRVLRRAARHGVLLGIEGPFLHEVVETVIDEMGGAYPELVERRAFIVDAMRREEERFGETLGRGLALLDEEVDSRAQARGAAACPATSCSSSTTRSASRPISPRTSCAASSSTTTAPASTRAMREQAERARAAWKGSGQEAPAEVYDALAESTATRFVGYESLEGKSPMRALLRDGAAVRERARGRPRGGRRRRDAVLRGERRPGRRRRHDRGRRQAAIEVEDTQKPVEGLIVHHRPGRDRPRSRVGDAVRCASTPARAPPRCAITPRRTSCTGRCATCSGRR